MSASKQYLNIALICALVFIFASVAMAQEHQWQDASGLFRVTARLVTFDDSLVVLKKSDGELIVLKRSELSLEDREFLMLHADSTTSKVNAESAVAVARVDKTDVDDAKNLQENATVVTGADAPAATADAREIATLTHWRLRNGDKLDGKLIGFGTQTFHLKRQGGVVRVEDTDIEDLPSAYELILPSVVSKIDRKPIANLKELEKHLAGGGGGPFAYEVRGIQLELKQGGVFTVPLEFLEPAEAELVSPGFERWLAARVESTSELDRYETDTRERLMLDSYARLRGEEQAGLQAMKLVELGLLSVNAGVTEIWEVGLLPNTPYGFPRSVLVPGRDSLSAQEIAVQRYPGWQVGYARKISD